MNRLVCTPARDPDVSRPEYKTKCGVDEWHDRLNRYFEGEIPEPWPSVWGHCRRKGQIICKVNNLRFLARVEKYSTLPGTGKACRY